MHDSNHHAHGTGEADASAQEHDEGAATLETREGSLASAQEDSVDAEYEQEEVAQSASLPTTPSHASTFPSLPNWAQLQASVSSPPRPDERDASRRRSFADSGDGGGGGGGGEERGRTIYSVPGEDAGMEEGEDSRVAKVVASEGGNGISSRPTLTDYCVRDLALEAVRQAQIAESEEAQVGEKRARSEGDKEDAEGEEDTMEDLPLAQRRRTDYPPVPAASTSTSTPAYAPQHPFAYPYPPQQTSYIHGLPHFSPPFSGGYQPYNPHSPICPPPAAPTTQAGRAVWGLTSSSATALGVYGSSSSPAAWRYDPNHALQQRGVHGGYQGSFLSPIPSVPPLQPPVLPPIQNQNQGQGYPYPRPSPAPAQQGQAAYDSDEEESQRFNPASSPATTRTTSGGTGSPATSIATPRPSTGHEGKEREREKEVPLVSAEGGAVKLDQQTPQQQAQQLVPIAPAPAPSQQEGTGGGGETGTKRKGGRGVTPKNAFTIDPIQGVKPFIVKLRWLLMHPEIAGDVVCWSEDGHSVLVKVGGDTSKLTEDILPRTFAHSNIAAFQRASDLSFTSLCARLTRRASLTSLLRMHTQSYGFTSLKGAALTAALHQSESAPSPPAGPSPIASTSAPQLPAFGPSAPNPSSSAPAPAREAKEWRAYTHFHTPSDALLARQAEGGGEEWEDEEWWFERDGMEDFVCLGRLKAKGKGGGGGGAKRSSTAGSARGAVQGVSGAQGTGGATGQGQGQGQSGVQGLLASFKIPNNGGGGT
ncbi:hypothetical protein BJY59DRAFT_708186 [Rhodotorula toruloides]